MLQVQCRWAEKGVASIRPGSDPAQRDRDDQDGSGG